MFIALNRWQIRNEAYHDSASKYAYNRDRLRLISDVTTRYFETKPDHFAITRLMSNPLEDLISGTLPKLPKPGQPTSASDSCSLPSTGGKFVTKHIMIVPLNMPTIETGYD